MTVSIAGIGLHRFGRTPEASGLEQGAAAMRAALADAGVEWKDLQFVIGGSRDAGRVDGLALMFGHNGGPMINVFNGCATGGSSLALAASLIETGQYEIGAVVGFDKHDPGAFSFDPSQYGLPDWYGKLGFAVTAQFFGLRIQRYMAEHGIGEGSLARVAAKAFRAGSLNELAWRRTPIAEEEILKSTMVCSPLRKSMFCSPSEGGAALVLCSERIARRLSAKAVRLASVAVCGKQYGAFEIFQTSLPTQMLAPVTTRAANAAFDKAGVDPRDVDIAQLQDTDSGAEIIHMAEAGLCAHGEQERLLAEGATDMRGRLPINTDGGCLANGEPIGASGLRQVYEVCLQLRGHAGARQAGKPLRTGMTHVYGAPGISVVSILQT
ncbi:MAG: thiolase family protein [Sinimarinibacterium sp.]|jgi:acetyl-CoA acetyltransferase